MDDVDLLGEKDVTQKGESREHGEQGDLVDYWLDREIEDLERVGEVSDALAICIGMSEDDDFVASFEEA